jgi:hypothetical protein
MLVEPSLQYLCLFESKPDLQTSQHNDYELPLLDGDHRRQARPSSRRDASLDTDVLARLTMQQLVSVLPANLHHLSLTH